MTCLSRYDKRHTLYLPSPLLTLRLRSGQAKEGNKKALAVFSSPL